MKTLRCISILIIITLIISCEKQDSDGFLEMDSTIIFISRRTENNGSWSLIRMDNKGTKQEKITEMTVNCQKPVISHSGNIILFTHITDDYIHELYSIDIDGNNLKLIDKANRFCGSADWSFDDSKIIYSKNRNESTDENDLILYDFISKEKITLTDSENNFSPKFSSENKIAFCRQNDSSICIYSMNLDGSDKHIIPDGDNPIWSPDGKMIAYVSYRTGSPQIFTAYYDGSNQKQLTDTFLPSWDSGFPSFGNYNPQWTPNGEMIVYQSDVNEGLPEIYIINNDGSHKKRLTDSERRSENPEISLNGKYILFSSNRDLNFSHDIYVMGIDGSNQHQLSKYLGDDTFPVIAKK